MAKNKKQKMGPNGEVIEGTGSKIHSIIVGTIIIAVWLVILCVLIKFDVGGFGSSVMYPIFKDVPVINNILPDGYDISED